MGYFYLCQAIKGVDRKAFMGERYNASVKTNKWHSGADRAHLIRYFIARGVIEPGDTVLDCGCGFGYGSLMLSKVAEKVISYDYSKDAINFAKNNHSAENIVYKVENFDTVENLEPADVVVCLEVMEHLGNPEGFITAVNKAVKRMFVFSVPLNEKPEDNPFHKQQFTEATVLGLVKKVPGWDIFHTIKQGSHLIGFMYKK